VERRRRCRWRVRERISGDAPGPRLGRDIPEPLGRRDILHIEEGWPVGLNCENGLHEIWTRVRHGPTKRPRLRVRQKNRWAHPLQQRHESIPVQFPLQCEVLNRPQLRRVELVEDRIAGNSLPRPLCVQVRLRPEIVTLRCGKPALGRFKIQRRGRKKSPLRLAAEAAGYHSAARAEVPDRPRTNDVGQPACPGPGGFAAIAADVAVVACNLFHRLKLPPPASRIPHSRVSAYRISPA